MLVTSGSCSPDSGSLRLGRGRTGGCGVGLGRITDGRNRGYDESRTCDIGLRTRDRF